MKTLLEKFKKQVEMCNFRDEIGHPLNMNKSYGELISYLEKQIDSLISKEYRDMQDGLLRGEKWSKTKSSFLAIPGILDGYNDSEDEFRHITCYFTEEYLKELDLRDIKIDKQWEYSFSAKDMQSTDWRNINDK